MKSYGQRGMDLPQSVFNYRFSRGRRVFEQAFRILTARFRIFQRPMQQEPPVVCRNVMACLILHNLLWQRYPTGQYDDFSQDGQPEPDPLEGHNLPYEERNPMEFVK